jgi:hypothetical protein
MNDLQELPFKICPMCEKHWTSRDAFLDDLTLFFNGYQANFGAMEQGLFYFTHKTTGCGSTMVIKAEAFLSLYSGKRYKKDQQLSKQCPRYCLERSQLKRCQVHCQHAFVREVTQIIMDRSHKTAAKVSD